MTAAAKNLTPVTLELGGKNPVFVCDDADISLAARRIAWGKSMNMGQACVAPDYVLVNKKQTMQLCKRLAENLRKFYGKDERKWSECKDLGRIVNKRHFDRIKDMLQREKGDIVIGGTCCEEKLFIQPTVIVTDLNSPFMEKEIFGPVLVVIQTDSIDQSILIAKRFEKPLALYVFSFDVEKQKKILESVSSGGVAINDTLLQASVMSLPFGGVGHSGFGKNHGKSGFDLFSNKRSVLSNNGSFDWSIRYPPYSKKGIKLAKYCSLKSCYCTRFFNSNMVTMVFLSVLVFFILWVNR
ncbi:hypothetical protein MHBO_003954 [Bonamia ostreae]|uniref:Aldehyde dehydrogenase domain-containing protein n=1 Tax=Bonamia ostreae TaxID=126728 RepID=A0ABV2AS02_9EUKA